MLSPLLDLLPYSRISPQAAQRRIRLHPALHHRITQENPDELEQPCHSLLHCLARHDVLPDCRIGERGPQLRILFDALPHGRVLQQPCDEQRHGRRRRGVPDVRGVVGSLPRRGVAGVCGSLLTCGMHGMLIALLRSCMRRVRVVRGGRPRSRGRMTCVSVMLRGSSRRAMTCVFVMLRGRRRRYMTCVRIVGRAVGGVRVRRLMCRVHRVLGGLRTSRRRSATSGAIIAAAAAGAEKRREQDCRDG
jgi:hypothetical protein